jgi:hypothetical protein
LFNFCLLRASDASFGVIDPFLNLLKVAENGPGTHLVKSKDVVTVNDHCVADRARESKSRWKVKGKG